MRQLEDIQILYAFHFDSLPKNEHGTRTRFLPRSLEFPKRQNDYFFRPSRRRSSLDEIAPSFFVRDRERSMIARNLRFVLRDTVTSSAFRIGTTAAKGFPRFTTITGSFLAF